MCKYREIPQRCKFCEESRGFIIETSEGFHWHPVCWRLNRGLLKEKPQSDVPNENKEKSESCFGKANDIQDDKKMETEILLVLNQSSSIDIEVHQDILSPTSQEEGFLKNSKINVFQEEKNENYVSSSSAILSHASPQYQTIVVESENENGSSFNLELENFLLTNFFKGIMRKDVLKAFHSENLSKTIDELLVLLIIL